MIQDHIHLFEADTSPVPSNAQARQFAVTQNGAQEKPATPVSLKRSVSGHLIRSFLPDKDGLPTAFRDRSLVLMVVKEDKEALALLSGLVCTYIPLDHDDSQSTLVPEDGYTCVAVIEDANPIDPYEQWWLVTVKLSEDTLS